MGKETGISWTDHTFNPWSLLSVNFAVTFSAQRQSVGDDDTQFGKLRKPFDMMRHEISASVVSAVLACKFVAQENVKSPTFVLAGKSFVAALREFSVFERVTFGTPLRSLSYSLADEGAGFKHVRHTRAIPVGSFLRGVAHLLTRIVTHLFPLHRRDE